MLTKTLLCALLPSLPLTSRPAAEPLAAVAVTAAAAEIVVVVLVVLVGEPSITR